MGRPSRITPAIDTPRTNSPSIRSQMSYENFDIHRTLNSSGCRKCLDHWKMVIVIIIPLTSLIVMASLALNEAIALKTAAEHSVASIVQATEYADLVKMLQRERGMSSIYISSHNLSTDFLNDVRNQTDSVLGRLQFPVNGLKVSNSQFVNKRVFKQAIVNWRANVTSRECRLLEKSSILYRY